MKHRIFTAGMAALLFSTCSVHEMDVEPLLYNNDEIFSATIEDASTKVFADDKLRVLWDADDRVSIFNKYTYNQEYRFAGETGDNSGSFKKIPNDDLVTGNALDYVYSVYPYKESTKIDNDGVITLTLPAEQSYRQDSFGIGANTMISCTEGNQLLFKNLCGYLMLKLYGDNVTVSSISLKGNNNETLAGKAIVNAAVDGTPSMSFSSAATNEITLVLDSPVTLGSTEETATTFWLVVPPTVFSKGFTLTVKDNKNGVFEKATTKSFEIERNKLARMSSLEIKYGNTPKNNIIYYTSTDGKIVTPNAGGYNWGANVNVISNEYINGIGVLTFDGDIIAIRGAFNGCTTLETITIPQSVTSIGLAAFYNCKGLLAVNLHEGITSIETNAFSGCSSIESLFIPRSVTNINTGGFNDCVKIEEIIVDPDNPKYDSRNNCNAIIETTSNTLLVGCKNTIIPEGIIIISDAAFKGCRELSSQVIPDSVKQIGSSAYENCSNLTAINIPEGISTIDYSTFKGCTNLISIILPETITAIEGHAFQGCQNLSSMNIPHSVVRIGGYAFSNCRELSSITIPSSVSLIGVEAFWYCSGLTQITILSTTPPTGNQSMFSVTNNCPIYVPASSVEAYKVAQFWRDYADRIQAIPSSVPIPEAIDLGLPSGLKWASFNLGASKPEEYGDYYAWGETEPKDDYSWSTYKWCEGSGTSLTKYCNNPSYGFNGFADDNMALMLSDDPARLLLGEGWRMPTVDEMQELRMHCTWELKATTIYGYRVKSKTNNNSIFLPASGMMSGLELKGEGTIGYYWTSSLLMPDYPWYVCFFPSVSSLYDQYRCYGMSIRPVYAE